MWKLVLQSKGGILQKACDYIRELQTMNSKLADRIKVSEDVVTDIDSLRQQCEDLRQENDILRELLQQHGIELPTPDEPGGLWPQLLLFTFKHICDRILVNSVYIFCGR